MKQFANTVSFNQVLWPRGCLCRAVRHQEVSALDAALCSGLTADEHAMCEANFQTLTACLPPSCKAVQQRNHRESLQKKKQQRGLLDCLWCVLALWKWTNCWLLKSKSVAGLRQMMKNEPFPREYLRPSHVLKQQKLWVRNTCRLPRACIYLWLSASAAAGHRVFPWFNGTQHLAAEIIT